MPARKHGLTEIEEHVLNLHDIAGMQVADIAREVGWKPVSVQQIVSRYGFRTCWGVGDATDAATRHACQLHAEAIAATGKRYA